MKIPGSFKVMNNSNKKNWRKKWKKKV